MCSFLLVKIFSYMKTWTIGDQLIVHFPCCERFFLQGKHQNVIGMNVNLTVDSPGLVTIYSVDLFGSFFLNNRFVWFLVTASIRESPLHCKIITNVCIPFCLLIILQLIILLKVCSYIHNNVWYVSMNTLITTNAKHMLLLFLIIALAGVGFPVGRIKTVWKAWSTSTKIRWKQSWIYDQELCQFYPRIFLDKTKGITRPIWDELLHKMWGISFRKCKSFWLVLDLLIRKFTFEMTTTRIKLCIVFLECHK